MVIKTANSFVIIMNIVTSVSVSSRGHCGNCLKIPPQLALKAPQILSDAQSPFELKGIKR